MEIKNKSFDLFTERYPYMLNEIYWTEDQIRFDEGHVIRLINMLSLTILPVVNTMKLQAKTSWGKKEYFAYSFDGFKLACEWFDKQRLILVEKLL